MEDKVKDEMPEAEEFLSAVISGCVKFVIDNKEFAFDIRFQVGEIKYRLSLAEDQSDYSYLKAN